MTAQTQSQHPNSMFMEYDEHILVVKRTTLLPENTSWQGLKRTGLDDFLTTVIQEREFLPRSVMETDPRYKQVIPYLIFTHNGKYFLMQRQAKASEQRLKNKYSLGIGGHIRREDFTSNDLMAWARREFIEEIDYASSYIVKPLGIINDDSNPVGEVHIGCVLLLTGDSADIAVKSELKSGKLMSLEECETYYPMMEEWSQHVFKLLKTL